MRTFGKLILIVQLMTLSVQADAAAQGQDIDIIESRLQRFFSLDREDLRAPSVRAIIDNDFETFAASITREGQPPSFLYQDVSYMHIAAAAGRNRIITHLVDQGADVGAPYGPGRLTPLHVAIAVELPETVSILISDGANVNDSVFGRMSPLHFAISKKNKEMVTMLVLGGASLEDRDSQDRSPLHYALSLRAFDVATVLYDLGADLDERLRLDRTFHHQAVIWNAPDVIEWLHKNGLDINARDTYSRTPLYLAVYEDKPEAFDALLRLECDVNFANNHEFTPLMITMFKPERYKYIQPLIDAGAYIEASRQVNGQTVLSSAAGYAGPEQLQLLMDAGAYAERVATTGWTLLRVAMYNEKLDNFKFLLEHGVNPDLRRGNNWPVLMWACVDGLYEYVRALVEHGANVNFQTREYTTPLMAAVKRGRTVIAEYLIEKGADPVMRDENGLTAWHWATVLNNDELADYLAAFMTEEQMQPTNRVRVYLDLDAPLAEEVSVVGEFNGWLSEPNRMTRREDDGWWYIELDLFPGAYAYKFDIGPSWILDPANPHRQTDSSMNTENSLLITEMQLVSTRPERPLSTADVYEPVYFVYTNARANRVSLAGEFNGWNTYAHRMTKAAEGIWFVQAELAPGEYMYKYVVDGDWIMDPNNPDTKYDGGVQNSLLTVRPREETE